jgi:hypothetical protein
MRIAIYATLSISVRLYRHYTKFIRTFTIRGVSYFPSKMIRDRRSPSMVLSRCILSTAVWSGFESRSTVLMLAQKESDSRLASSYSPYTDMFPECDHSPYKTR